MSNISTATSIMQRQMEEDRARFEAERQQREMERAYNDLQGQLGRQSQAGGLISPGGAIGGSVNPNQYPGSPLPGNYQYGSNRPVMDEEKPSKRSEVFRKEVTIAEAKRLLVPLLSTPIVPFLWGPPGVGKCLDGMTDIYTPIGMVKLKDLKVGDRIYGIDKKGVKTEGTVQHLFRQVSKKLLKIKTGNQNIICSPEHRFLLTTGLWKSALAPDKHGDSVVLYVGEIQPHQKMVINRGRSAFNLMARGKIFRENCHNNESISQICTTKKMEDADTQEYFDRRISRISRMEYGSLEKRTDTNRISLHSRYFGWRRNSRFSNVCGNEKCLYNQTLCLYNQYLNGSLQLPTVDVNGIYNPRSEKIQRWQLLPVQNVGFTSKKVFRKTSSVFNHQEKQSTTGDRILSKKTQQRDWNPLYRRGNEACSTCKKREFRGGKISAINSIFTGKNGRQTYDIETTLGNYIANGIVVHNSEIVKAIADEKGWELIDLRLSLLNPVDLRGLPVVNKEDRRADWYHPSFLPNGHNKKKGILFLDEINLAPLSVQAAAYQLILDKQIGDYRFPKDWMMIAAGNRTEDRANVYKISAPLANRFAHFTIVPDFSTWREWAVGKVRSEIIDFLIVRPALLFQMPREGDQAFPTPRSWTFLSSLLTAYRLDEGMSSDIQHVVMGTIGASVGEEFLTHLETYDLKDIAEKIDKFVATGKISLPSDATATRFAIIQAILDAHLSGKVNNDRFDTFKKKLSGEETATIEAEIKRRLAPSLDYKGIDTQIDDAIPY